MIERNLRKVEREEHSANDVARAQWSIALEATCKSDCF
jgi:hypothetical protein